MLEQDRDGCQFYETPQVFRIILPLTQEAALPLQAGQEPIHQATPLVAAQTTSILGSGLRKISSGWRDQFNAIRAQFLFRFIAVLRAVTDQVLRFRFDHVAVKTQLRQGDFVIISRVHTDCQREPVAIDNPFYFQSLTALAQSNLIAAALGPRKVGVDKAFRFSSSSRPAHIRHAAHWRDRSARRAVPRCGAIAGDVDEPCCSLNSTASACVIAHR